MFDFLIDRLIQVDDVEVATLRVCSLEGVHVSLFVQIKVVRLV